MNLSPCPNCGYLNPQGSTYCGRCGVNLMTFTPLAPLPRYAPTKNRKKELITIGVVVGVIIVLLILIAALMLPGVDQWPEDGTYDLPASELIVRDTDLSSEWEEISFSGEPDRANLHLNGPDGSYLIVLMNMYPSSDVAGGVYDSIRSDYEYSGGSHDLGIGNRSCYQRFVSVDDGETLFILAAFQKGNVVVQFDYSPGFGSISLSDLKDVAEEQYRKIQN